MMMKWSDGDPPASDINVARMRAKYYGAQYIIHRPLLHHALHPVLPKLVSLPSSGAAESPAASIVSSSQSQVSPSMGHAQQAEPMERRFSDMAPPARAVSTPEQVQFSAHPLYNREVDSKILDACRICVQAAVNSTIAFDGVEGRPVITNVFGTAHA